MAQEKRRRVRKPRQRRPPRKRHWCFTSFDEKFNPLFDDKFVRYCIFQEEKCADTGRRHYQGYIEFFDNVRRSVVVSVVGAGTHVEVRKGSRTEAREYCRKKDTSIPNTQVEFGTWRADVSRKRKLCDMLHDKISLDELIEESPVDYVRYHRGLEKLFSYRASKLAKLPRKDLQVIVYWGPTGTGKTWRAMQEPDHYRLPFSKKTTWFDGYTTEKCLIIDDYLGNIAYPWFLQLIDIYEMQVPFKGGFVWGQWTKIIITSNKHPRDWYPDRGFTAPLQRRIKQENIHHLVDVYEDSLSGIECSPINVFDFT